MTTYLEASRSHPRGYPERIASDIANDAEAIAFIAEGIPGGSVDAAAVIAAIETDGSLDIDVEGNAATATKLLTARTIGGTAFDGTANITPANATNATAVPFAGVSGKPTTLAGYGITDALGLNAKADSAVLADDATPDGALDDRITALEEAGGGAEPETILVAGAISNSLPVSYLSGASGSYAVTLAAPDASMIGKTKLIEYTVGAGVVTLNATNIDDTGETAPTLDNTFSVVGQCIVLVGTSTKWLLISQAHTS